MWEKKDKKKLSSIRGGEKKRGGDRLFSVREGK